MVVPAVATGILETIGNTPVVQLQHLAPRDAADIFVKLEVLQSHRVVQRPDGARDDRRGRSAWSPAARYACGRVTRGGSTGSSLAMVCAVKGYAFHPLSSDAFAPEKIRTMEAFGAAVEMVPSDGGKVTPALFDRFKQRIASMVDEPGTFWTDQFHNADALNGYREIGVELLAQVGSIDVFCGAVGTAGMLVGVSRAVKAGGNRVRVVALEPAGSPILTAGRGGAHRVEGTAPGFVPPHLTSADYDEARAIDEDEARAMARRLAREEGIFAGVSTGLNIVAALQLARELGPGRRVATVAVDTGLKYLAGDLFART